MKLHKKIQRYLKLYRKAKAALREATYRCHNVGNKDYANWGGRGIYVCERWRRPNKNLADTFIEDVGLPPSLEHSLDRIDNNGPYSPENCRWATRSEQQSNTRRSRYITAFGITRTASQWNRFLGVHHNYMYVCITVQGLTAEEAVTRAGGV